MQWLIKIFVSTVPRGAEADGRAGVHQRGAGGLPLRTPPGQRGVAGPRELLRQGRLLCAGADPQQPSGDVVREGFFALF